ncbi:Pentatricopeptide repeat-containing protein At3g16010 [Olea europaea subsp. europaea]|uniref:Pentatricopeptide repeat-containing protein At3g16010 n=1 Tax=Olea europaea subsp. europaea TaxID=158383 RepID=A0A8S0SZD9_OLEEU|nr:Pentatricopeptide repeat-containing protein At3g16010 [Olea europaea subsp. europaea]
MNSLTPRLDALPILLIYPQNQKPQAAIHHLQSRARRSRMYGGKNHTEDKEKMVVEDVAAFPNNKKKMFVIRHNLQQHFANSHSDSLSGVHNIIPSSLVNLISRTVIPISHKSFVHLAHPSNLNPFHLPMHLQKLECFSKCDTL